MNVLTMTSLVVRMASLTIVAALVAWNSALPGVRAQAIAEPRGGQDNQDSSDNPVTARWRDDLAAMATYRPGYAFWQHIFRIPDGSIAYGSAADGRLLAVFPSRGDWTSDDVWVDRSLAGTLDGVHLPRSVRDRRDEVARLIENVAGPVVHNPTRGRFLSPNAQRYGGFIDEWRAIYERFGVPADLGLAQAVLESGLNGTRRSRANAVGLCQWLRRNWTRLDRLSPVVLEVHNQTTQAPYCAAYLSILGTKYGSFIPALSEHNAGGTNVGRTLINGERLGGEDVRSRYFLGSQLAHDLRALALDEYRDLYRTYGLRSYLYAEMVFGNMATVQRIAESTRQARIYAMRPARAVPLSEVVKRTRLSVDEIRRYNPALVRRVPAHATLYLPSYNRAFGPDVTFWHRPAPAAFTAVLDDFLRLDATPAEWDDPSFQNVLRGFQRRFRETHTEEGTVMSTVLAYVIEEASTSGRRELLAEFQESDDITRLLEQGLSALETEHAVPAVSVTD